MCAHCKHKLYHKDGNCLELEANKAKRYPGWKSVLTKEYDDRLCAGIEVTNCDEDRSW